MREGRCGELRSSQDFESSPTTAMTSYAPAPLVKHPLPPSSTRTTDNRYWRRYKSPTYIKEYAPVTHVSFAPNKPHRLAVTASSEVKIYAPRSNKVVKTVARFKETARSGEIREDGNLMVAGDDSGLVQVSVALARIETGRELRADREGRAGVQSELARDPEVD